MARERRSHPATGSRARRPEKSRERRETAAARALREAHAELARERARRLAAEAAALRLQALLEGGRRTWRITRNPHSALRELELTGGDSAKGGGRRPEERAGIAGIYQAMLRPGRMQVRQPPATAELYAAQARHLERCAETGASEVGSGPSAAERVVFEKGPEPLSPADALARVATLEGISVRTTWEIMRAEQLRREAAGLPSMPLPPRPR